MGWYEQLSGSNKQESPRTASGIERNEIKQWRSNHKQLKSDESLGWVGHLFTGYHIQKVKKDESIEYLKTGLPGDPSKLNTKINQQ